MTGTTGNTGSALVELLTRRGVPVRAMVRREADAARFSAMPTPVSVAVADFDDPDSLAAAVAGVARVYLVAPSSEQAEARQRRFAQIAAEAGVGQATPTGTLTIGVVDAARLLVSLRPTGAASMVAAATMLLRFGGFFAGRVLRAFLPSAPNRRDE